MSEYYEYDCEKWDECEEYPNNGDCDDFVHHEKELNAKLIIRKVSLEKFENLTDYEQSFFLLAFGYYQLIKEDSGIEDLIIKEKIQIYNVKDEGINLINFQVNRVCFSYHQRTL